MCDLDCRGYAGELQERRSEGRLWDWSGVKLGNVSSCLDLLCTAFAFITARLRLVFLLSRVEAPRILSRFKFLNHLSQMRKLYLKLSLHPFGLP